MDTCLHHNVMATNANAAGKTVAKVWTFTSESNPDKEYECMQYTDLSTSCNCRGWTLRVDARGQRSCRHTRLVDMGKADAQCVSMHDYTKEDTRVKLAFETSVTKAKDTLASGKRRMSF